MSFFIIQVQTNYESIVQKTLAHILEQKKVNIVKSIYALDTQAQLNRKDNNPDNIKQFLDYQRLREQLRNMRYAYANIDKSQVNLKNEYRQNIQFLTRKVKEYPNFSKGKTIVKGYILIELNGDFQKIPSSIYYDIKSIPKVIAIPSTFNVPLDEVKEFFTNLQEEAIV